MNTMTKRPIHEIASDIKADWKKVNYGAMPYLSAMCWLDKPTDNYGGDSATIIITYFLSNASSWRGDKAKAIKKELKELIK
jgi:hypothetical protein